MFWYLQEVQQASEDVLKLMRLHTDRSVSPYRKAFQKLNHGKEQRVAPRPNAILSHY